MHLYIGAGLCLDAIILASVNLGGKKIKRLFLDFHRTLYFLFIFEVSFACELMREININLEQETSL